MRVSLRLESFGVSDKVTERIGIRDIYSVIDPGLSGHVFYINAEKVRGLVLCMLHVTWTSTWKLKEVRMLAVAH